jgi:hypothetical protein
MNRLITLNLRKRRYWRHNRKLRLLFTASEANQGFSIFGPRVANSYAELMRQSNYIYHGERA